MYPILLKIGPLVIHTYGVMVALGFLAAVILSSSRAHEYGLERDRILDLSFWILLAALVGARALEIITNLAYYQMDWWKMFKIWEGGLSYFGGLAGGVAGGVVYCLKTKLPVWTTGDLLAPYLALGQAIGRIGCFFAGCCYGKACDYWFALKFENTQSLAPTGIPLYPTQIFEAVGDFVVFLLLLNISRRRQFPGQIFLLYFVLYASVRLVVEFYRGDNPVLGLGFTLYQFICIAILVVALVIYVVKWKKQRVPSQ